MRIEVLRPLHIRRVASGETFHLRPGPVDLPDEDAIRLMAKKPDAVRPVVEPGDWVTWLSPALPAQEGEVLGIDGDGTFSVFHPLSETLCRLPVAWITRLVKSPINPEGSIP